jgi:hypothetical protein
VETGEEEKEEEEEEEDGVGIPDTFAADVADGELETGLVVRILRLSR